MKKIVCIHLYNDFSGSPFVLSQSINILSKNNYIVDLYTSDTEGFLSDTKSNKFNVFYKRSNNKIGVLLFYLFSQFILFFKLLKYRNEAVIFYINTIMPFGAALAGKLLGIKVVYHIHETSIRPKLLKSFLKNIIGKTSNFNISVSKYLMESDKIKNIKSQVVYNALPDAFVKKASLSKYLNNSENFTVLMICSLKKYKGINEFIEIANKCQENKKILFQLVLNATKDEIDNFFQNISVPNNIVFYPSQKDVSVFYATASLVLNLSRVDQWVETFGMTILEAMNYGIPCIVPSIGGPVELVDSGTNGYCISSYDIDKISTLILKLAINEELLLKLSFEAKTKAKLFSSDNFENSILEIFGDV